ncbi:MAG: cell division protein FtsW [Lachnospiraceae bacterium]|nr:cell division protein FtsW [Lachnospiraceae bacterium]
MGAGRKRRKVRSNTGEYFDYNILIIVALLVIFGLIMIYSTSSYNAMNEYNDAYHYLKRQGVAIIGGIIAMIFTIFFPLKYFLKFSELIYVISLVAVVLVLSPLGRSEGGATRWIYIGPISIQSAELVKISIILLLATFICKYNSSLLNKWKILFAFMVPSLIAAAMIFFITNNLSSAIIVVGIAFVMLFVASPNYSKFFAVVGAGLAVVLLAVMIIVRMANSADGNFRVVRVLAWLDPEAYSNDTGYQILQSLYAIGSGGIFGKGLGESMQKLGFIPESQNDMIFSIICEELGLCGAFMLIFLFGLLLWRMMLVAINTRNKAGCLVVVGVIAHIAIQVVLNIAVVTNSIPNTGISLPFISYGGSSVLCLLVEIGLVLNVSRNIKV